MAFFERTVESVGVSRSLRFLNYCNLKERERERERESYGEGGHPMKRI